MTRLGTSLVLAVLWLVGCSAPSNAVYAPTALPDAAAFPYVAEVMVLRCGTLDCHGSVSRNLRVYGDEGLRFSASDRPCAPTSTTGDEVAQDYDSVVGLEPETMSEVVADHGANPERLTFIAKPLGIEGHKGGTVFQVGDDTYRCLTSWLAGATETSACLAAMPETVCGLSPTASVDAGAQ